MTAGDHIAGLIKAVFMQWLSMAFACFYKKLIIPPAPLSDQLYIRNLIISYRFH